MTCEEVQSHLIEMPVEEWHSPIREELEGHIKGCEQCALESAEQGRLWQLMQNTPEALPGPGLEEKFRHMLHTAVEEQKASRPVRRLSPIWNIAAAVILLAAGIGIGIRVASPGHQEGQPGTVATATHHGDSTDALVFTLLQEESASQRIKAVNYAENMTSPDPKVIGALINTLDHDKNVNVRLTCLYSLTKFSDNLLVRDALVASLTRQTEPIVQIVLINLLTEMKEPKARRSFQEIISNEKSSKEVKNIAEKGLRTI